MPRILAMFLVCLTAPLAFGQSLWQPGFTGYLVGTSSVGVGGPVLVTIDTNTKLSYSASNVSDRTLTLQFSGGGSGGLFSFLPEGTSGEKASLKGDETLGLTGKLMTRVQRVDANGLLLVEGSRSMSVNGREQVLSISGLVDPRLLKNDTIPFGDLADAKLVYRSILESAPVLTESDINEIMQQLSPQPAAGAPAAPAGGAASNLPPAPAAGQPPATGTAPGPALATPAAPPQPTYALTDATKKRLLLQYLNAILGLIFKPSASQPPAAGPPGPAK